MEALLATTVFTRDRVVLVALVTCLGLFLVTIRGIARSSQNAAHSRLWDSLDVVGVRHPGVFPWTKAILGSVFNTAQNAANGYQRFCKAQNKPFALPNIWTGSAVVVLPPSLLGVLNRPDRELAAHRAQHETIQLPYMIADREVYDNPIHFEVARRLMSRNHVGSLAAATAEELDRAFRTYWREGGTGIDGDNHNWVTLNNWNACGKVMSRAAMRILVGEPLCQNEQLLKLSMRYADAVIQGTAIINCMPPFLRPWIAPLFGLPAKYFQRRCLRILRPLIQERVRAWEMSKLSTGQEMPNDFLQWMIERSAKAGSEQMDASRIALRLLALTTMSVMGMVWVLSHCIQDLYRSSSKEEFLAGLEEECKNLINNYGLSEQLQDLGSKDVIDRLHRLDSTLRESMRLSSISIVSLARDVVGEELDLGEYDSLYDGLKIPKGVRITFPSQSMHKDSDFMFHDNPLEFDAFRFSRSFEGTQEYQDSGKVGLDRAAASSTFPSESFLVWGYGKHACTGRWYAAQTLKQALAYIILNYDIHVLGESRENMSLVNVVVPNLDVKIKVRRKKFV